jgi:hypothetical protein
MNADGIVVINADGTSPRTLVARDGGAPNVIYANFPNVAYSTRPFMAPDGKQILFNKRGSDACSVWSVTDRRGAREIIRNGCTLSWAPDGSRIVLTVGLDWSW